MSIFFPLAAALATQTPLPPVGGVPLELQAVTRVQVLAAGAPMPERRPGRIQAFYAQGLLTQAGVRFDISPEAAAALRERYRLGGNDYFQLSEWVSQAPGRPSRHLDYLYCAVHIRWFRGIFDTCFRDADHDGRLEGVAVFDRMRFPIGGLSYDAIDPIPYHFVQSARVYRGGATVASYVWPGLGVAWNLDRESGRLRFYAQVLDRGMRADVDPPVELDPAALPATIEIAGAQITVLSWDGHKPTVRVDRPFTDQPIRLITPDDYLHVMLGGSRRGWRIEISDVPLPGSPPPPDAPVR
jgi:hypothetical protein